MTRIWEREMLLEQILGRNFGRSVHPTRQTDAKRATSRFFRVNPNPELFAKHHSQETSKATDGRVAGLLPGWSL